MTFTVTGSGRRTNGIPTSRDDTVASMVRRCRPYGEPCDGVAKVDIYI